MYIVTPFLNMQVLGKGYGSLYNLTANVSQLGEKTRDAAAGTALDPVATVFYETTGLPYAVVSKAEPRLNVITNTDFKGNLAGAPKLGTGGPVNFRDRRKGFVAEFAGAIKDLSTQNVAKVDLDELKRLAVDPPMTKPEKKQTFRQAAKKISKQRKRRK